MSLRKSSDQKHKTMPEPSTSNEELPISRVKSELITIFKADTFTSCVVLGETGSGKSTQIPQYVHESGIVPDGKLIACTQPRRVAAVTLAMRVADEMNVQLGGKVGYNVRFEHMITDESKIIYMTDGILLREAIHDRYLSRYSVIILDEAHERTLHTDVLFGIVKRAQRLRSQRQNREGQTSDRPPLKIIIMSATMDADALSKYFNEAPVYFIEGRLHPIELFYTESDQSDYQHSALVTIFQIHTNEKPGTILVFLTGQEEIEHMQGKIRDLAHNLPGHHHKIDVVPLYAALNSRQQARAFQPVKQYFRRVILATNIAETSLTIPNVKYVIDTGKVKSRLFDPDSRMNQLRVINVSKAQACQRTGRAGRNQPGKCYRLYSEQTYTEFKDNATPEILRCSLSSVILDLLSWRADVDLHQFDFIDRPDSAAIQAGIDELEKLGAVVKEADSKTKLLLTKLGQKMAAFPIDPKYSRMIVLASTKHQCLNEILRIIAVMTHENVLINHSMNRENAESAHAKFLDDTGDHLQMLNVFEAYARQTNHGDPDNTSRAKKWCQENFIQERNMQTAVKVYEQLRDICTKTCKLSLNENPAHRDVVRQALCNGLFGNAAELDASDSKNIHYKVLSSGVKAYIHPSSHLHGKNPSFIVYSELVLTTKLYMREVTVVTKQWLQDAITSKNTESAAT